MRLTPRGLGRLKAQPQSIGRFVPASVAIASHQARTLPPQPPEWAIGVYRSPSAGGCGDPLGVDRFTCGLVGGALGVSFDVAFALGMPEVGICARELDVVILALAESAAALLS